MFAALSPPGSASLLRMGDALFWESYLGLLPPEAEQSAQDGEGEADELLHRAERAAGGRAAQVRASDGQLDYEGVLDRYLYFKAAPDKADVAGDAALITALPDGEVPVRGGEHGPPPLIVVGPSGVGKTALLRRWAAQVRVYVCCYFCFGFGFGFGFGFYFYFMYVAALLRRWAAQVSMSVSISISVSVSISMYLYLYLYLHLHLYLYLRLCLCLSLSLLYHYNYNCIDTCIFSTSVSISTSVSVCVSLSTSVSMPMSSSLSLSLSLQLQLYRHLHLPYIRIYIDTCIYPTSVSISTPASTLHPYLHRHLHLPYIRIYIDTCIIKHPHAAAALRRLRRD